MSSAADESLALDPTGPAKQPGLQNLAEPIRLQGLNLAGFAAETALQGTQVKVSTCAAMTSDEPQFHIIAKSARDAIIHHSNIAGHRVDLGRASTILLIIHVDNTADLYVDSAAVAVEIMAKRSVRAMEPIFEDDVADIRSMGFPAVEFKADDRVLCWFREGWKFGLLYDLRTGRTFDRKAMERELGAMLRFLRYQFLYNALGDAETFRKTTSAGWFPFIEIIAGEFSSVLRLLEANLDPSGAEQELIQRFDRSRLQKISERWGRHPRLKDRTTMLRSGLDSFERRDAVACLKTLLTEIEGILQDAHIAEHGEGATIGALQRFASARGATKAEGIGSLFFPDHFQTYLSESVYAKFDPKNPAKAIASRHSVGHGGAGEAAYTLARALQVILTIDQLAFYL